MNTLPCESSPFTLKTNCVDLGKNGLESKAKVDSNRNVKVGFQKFLFVGINFILILRKRKIEQRFYWKKQKANFEMWLRG